MSNIKKKEIIIKALKMLAEDIGSGRASERDIVIIASYLDDTLDELLCMDYFGVEGERDPRGISGNILAK